MSTPAKGRKGTSILDFFSKSTAKKKPNVKKKLVSTPSTVASDEEEPVINSFHKPQEKKKPPPNKPEPNYPIGTQVEKFFFGHGLFQGRVTRIRYDEAHVYGVTYEDGDVENYSENELKAILCSATVKRLSPLRTKSDSDCTSPEKKKPSSARGSSRSNKRRIDYNESEDDDEDTEEEIASSRRKTSTSARTKAVLESSDEEADVESVASESEQAKKRPAKKNKISNVDKVSNQEMDKDVVNTVASVDKSGEVEVKRPAKKNKTRNAWGSLVAYKGPVRPTKKPAVKKSTIADGEKKGGGKAVKAAYMAGDDLPIISHPQGMFDDMISVQLTDNGTNIDILIPMLKKLHNRPLRMATMCSGTESPVLALDMLSKALDDFYHTHKENFHGIDVNNDEPLLQIEHVFSCEIEPFKQAYIERNFQPPLLFRDIRELAHDHAYTAYGSLADVPCQPGSVDLLVAGTSCVDYSNLNTEKKTIDQSGESGQTWRGMIEWIRKAAPPIVIIENVKNAPWDKKILVFEGLGYHAIFCAVDTKQYYIPHTRQRGYLFAIKKDPKKSEAKTIDKNILTNWKEMLVKLRRPASAALDAFMLPNDDPRVLRGRARLTASNGSESSDRNNRVDWVKCEARHQFARASEELGEKRPLTGWSDSGNTTMPSFAWNEWSNAQVHRIHDLLDISTLRCAQDGIDCTYKTMVWNLSQNVDRDTMGKLGLCQCLTPSGVPYVSNRGGPLVGEELLLLQGIPADDLLLTKESEDNLKDLAGNAMSTTVVGACMLSALVLGHSVIGPGNAGKHTVVPTLVPRPLAPASSGVRITREMATYSGSSLMLGPIKVTDGDDSHGDFYRKLLQEAASSSRMCVSEVLDMALPVSSMLQCKLCGFTTSMECATPPRKFEEHDFVGMQDFGTTRSDPSRFRSKLLAALPMCVELCSFSIEAIQQPSGIDDELWSGWREAAVAATASSERSNRSAEYRFIRLTRSHIWTAVYSAPGDSRLEFQLSKVGAVWLLFGRAPPQKGPLQESLIRPIARMHVTPKKCQRDIGCLFTSGRWEVCLPKTSSVDLIIEGIGNKVSSWRSKLGLKGGYASEVRHEKLKMSVQGDGYDTLKSKIDGEYVLLPKCGGACGSLHKRQQDNPRASSESVSSDMFFFLESGRRTVGDDDSFVFAHDKHRTAYGEYRDIIVQIDPALNYRTDFYVGVGGSDQHAQSKRVRALIPGDWVEVNDASLQLVSDRAENAGSTLVVPVDGSMLVSLSPTGWNTCPEILCCELPIAVNDKLYMECDRVFSRAGKNSIIEVNLQKSAKIFDNLAFVISRLSTPNAVAQEWLALDSSGIDRVDGEEVACSTCAPPRPAVKWTVVTRSNKKQVIPLDDGREAALYEQLMKHRPNPWLVTLRLTEQQQTQCSEKAHLQLQIGCNAVSLVYRALGLFPPRSLSRRAMVHHVNSSQGNVSGGDCIFEWRVVPHVEKSSESGDFPKLHLTSNKKDKPASQPPEYKSRYPLRQEQLRSLAWMLSQESSSTPFLEEEVAEAVLPSINWRAEGRARRPVLVRGGIVADEVGYGKTAITLGLVDAAPHVNGEPPCIPEEFAKSFFHSQATLVIVPSHLMGQWPNEINKFLGSTKKVLRINDMSSLNKLTIEDIQMADIILVNFGVLSGEKYFERLARFAGVDTSSLPKGGKTGGRHFDAVYSSCLDGVGKRVSQLRDGCSTAFSEIEKDAERSRDLASHDDHLRLDGKKSVYKTVSEEQVKVAVSVTVKAKSPKRKGQKSKASTTDIDPWNLRTVQVKNDVKKMACPPLEMFFFNRVVLDEFSYCCQKEDRSRVLALVKGLKCHFRWCLSGTPPHANFKDVQSLAGLLGIHLGVDDILPDESLKIKKGSNEEKQKSGLEKFSSLLEIRSMQWHERRHQIGQDFLNRFVRQNIAEIDEIKYEEHPIVMDLPPAERAIYLELENYLKSLEMNSKKALKSKKSSKGDRENRMQRILSDSETAEEALLKRCAHFNMSSKPSTALETCDLIIDFRKTEKADCENELTESIAAAFRQRKRVLAIQPDWLGTARTEKGEVQDLLERFISDVLKKNSIAGGADDEIHQQVLEILKMAQIEAEKNSSKADPTFEKANCDEEDEGQDEELTGKKRKRTEKRDPKERLYAMKFALREHMHKVRNLVKELRGRMQSLRYFEWVRNFQLEETELQCIGRHSAFCECQVSGERLTRDKLGVLSSCGHVGCLKCLRHHADREECIEPTCHVPVKYTHIASAKDLGAERDHAAGGQYGAKLRAIVDKIKQLVHDGDRVIVFVQFDDLKEKVSEALQNSGVKSLRVKGTVQQQVQALNILQKEIPGKEDPRVLLLKMDDEKSSGINLTTCNHAVFVHPLLADTQQQYDAYETQAIGRIRRYGQTKKVHIWRYLARDTIDTEIAEERLGIRPI